MKFDFNVFSKDLCKVLASERAFGVVVVICFILTIISMIIAPDTEYNAAPLIFAVIWYLVATGGEGFNERQNHDDV